MQASAWSVEETTDLCLILSSRNYRAFPHSLLPKSLVPYHGASVLQVSKIKYQQYYNTLVLEDLTIPHLIIIIYNYYHYYYISVINTQQMEKPDVLLQPGYIWLMHLVFAFVVY